MCATVSRQALREAVVLFSAVASDEASLVAEVAMDLSDTTADRLLLSAMFLILERLLAALGPAALSSMDAVLARLGLGLAVHEYLGGELPEVPRDTGA